MLSGERKKQQKNFDRAEKSPLTCSAHLSMEVQGHWKGDAKSCLLGREKS